MTQNKRARFLQQAAINLVFIIVALCCVIPIIYILAAAFTDELSLAKYGYKLWPSEFSLDAFGYIFKNPAQILNAYVVTIIVTVLGTLVSILCTSMLAYAIARKDFKLSRVLSFLVFFTLLFNGGMVPSYIINTQYYHKRIRYLSGSDLEEVTLTWYIPGNGPQADTDKVEDAIYEYLKDDLNVRLNFVECDWGSYDDKVQMAIASQENFDFCYTAHWSNNFYNNISKNAFLELEDLLDEYAPALKESVPQAGWDASTVNGHIYGVPNVQAWAYQGFVAVRDDILEKYNFDLSTVKGLKDLDPLFEQVKADDPTKYPIVNCGMADILNNFQNTLNFEELTGSKIPGVLQYGDEEFKVVNQWELPQVQEFLQLMYDWNQKGYFKSDSATLTDYLPEITSGRSIAQVGATYSPASQASAEKTFGQPVTLQTFGTSHISTSSIVAALTAISRTSEHPDRAIQFLERVNTDPVLYNLICFGIEDLDYTREGNVVTAVENSGYDPNQDWAYGNQFNAYVRAGQPEDIWDLMKANNDAAEPSPILGFAFDSVPVQTELASVSAVVDEYYLSLSTGSVNPEEKLPEFLDKLEKAGSQTIIDECQRQLDEWLAANK